jgi:nitrate reductase gamma subunit
VDGQVGDRLLFAALPYVSLLAFGLTSLWWLRPKARRGIDLTTALMDDEDNRRAVVLLRCGILMVVIGHLLAFALPQGILWWNGDLLRLHILEVLALAFGLVTLASMMGIVVRCLSASNIRAVACAMDWVLCLVLSVQVLTGVCVAVFYPWGSAWFASILSPYLWSIVRLSPDLSAVVSMPLLVKVHIALGFVTLGILPLSRLVHALIIPKCRFRSAARLLRGLARRRQEMTMEA